MCRAGAQGLNYSVDGHRCMASGLERLEHNVKVEGFKVS